MLTILILLNYNVAWVLHSSFFIVQCTFVPLCFTQASSPAKTLLEEKDRKKFFQKYSSVSQELEKCLDCLLLISDSVTALGEEDTLGMF